MPSIFSPFFMSLLATATVSAKGAPSVGAIELSSKTTAFAIEIGVSIDVKWYGL